VLARFYSHITMTMTPRRRNGFAKPYSGAQISAWIAFALTLVQFLFFIAPLLPVGASVPVTLFFVFLYAGTLYYGIVAQYTDPMDIHLSKHIRDHQPPSVQNNKNTGRLDQHCNPIRVPPENESLKQCWICDTQVAEHSMHCKFCNKCVGKFDHHCKCTYFFYSLCKWYWCHCSVIGGNT
jgi:DHHC palmitoyltransferase